MKKLLTAVIAISAALSLCACSVTGGSNGSIYDDEEAIADTYEVPVNQDKDHDISLITNSKGIENQYNLTLWKNIIAYGDSNCKTYKQYTVGKDGDILEVIRNAADHNSKIVVLADTHYKEALFGVSESYPDTNFITASTSQNELFDENVHCISFREEQAGYLAGYLSVLDGSVSLGFIGDGENDSNMRYLYGMVQGADDATQKLRIHDVNIKFRFVKNNVKSAKNMADDFFGSGIDTIFTCTQNIARGAAQAAKSAKKKIICAGEVYPNTAGYCSGYILYDTIKATDIVIKHNFDSDLHWINNSDDKDVCLGIDSGCLYMQPDNKELWCFKNVTAKDYSDIYDKIASGEKEIISSTDQQPPIAAVVYSEF